MTLIFDLWPWPSRSPLGSSTSMFWQSFMTLKAMVLEIWIFFQYFWSSDEKQTDGKWCIWAHRALAQVGSNILFTVRFALISCQNIDTMQSKSPKSCHSRFLKHLTYAGAILKMRSTAYLTWTLMLPRFQIVFPLLYILQQQQQTASQTAQRDLPTIQPTP